MDWVAELFDGPYHREYERLKTDSELAKREAEFIYRELDLGLGDCVLDLCCGQGRHAMKIAPKVADVVGIDRTKRFIDFARVWAAERQADNLEFVQADMRQLDFEDKFDAVYNYFTSWGYYDDDTNFEILRRIHRALKPRGKFLMEFINRDALMRRYQQHNWVKLSADRYLIEDRSFNYKTGRQQTKRTYLGPHGAKQIEMNHALPAPEELRRLFGLAGFDDIRIVAAPDGGEPTIDTLRIALIGIS